MLKPMLASLADAPLVDPGLAYEPKYDGIRAIAEVSADGAVRLWSRLGNDKTSQFPEIAAALTRWARRRRSPVVLDGEIVALDAKGRPTGFQQLQGRIHVAGEVDTLPGHAQVAFIAFDLLQRRRHRSAERPLLERRAALERLLMQRRQGRRPSAERARSRRRPRALRSGDGQRLGRPHRQTDRLPLPVGQADARLAQAEDRPGAGIRRRRLDRAETRARVFWRAAARRLRGGRARLRRSYRHRIRRAGAGAADDTVATARHDDLSVQDSAEEQRARRTGSSHARRAGQVHRVDRRMPNCGIRSIWDCETTSAPPRSIARPRRDSMRPPRRGADPNPPHRRRVRRAVRTSEGGRASSPAARPTARGRIPRASSATRPARLEVPTVNEPLIELLKTMEEARQDGVLDLGGGQRLSVTNLHKLFWPKQKLTKGDLFRYYAPRRAVPPSRDCRPAARDEAISEWRRRQAVLPASGGRSAGRRARRVRAGAG